MNTRLFSGPVARRVLLAGGWYRPRPDDEDGRAPLWRIAKRDRPRCGARTRRGTPCAAPCVHLGDRCRMHGGLSTGPKTAEGRARIAEAQRRRWEAYRVGRCGESGTPQRGG